MFDARKRVRHLLRSLGAAATVALCLLVVPLAVPASAASAAAAPAGGSARSWPLGGHDPANTRSNPFETTINRFNARDLTLKWSLAVHGDVSATPAVVDGAVYFPDWGGFFSKVDARTGRLLWSHRVSEYNGLEGSVSRSSPAVWRGLVFIGDQGGALGAGARLMAIDARSGRLVWSRLVERHSAAILTQSPMVFGGVVYQGVSSAEEAAALVPGYPCCTFRGSVLALDAASGRVLWQTYTVPDNGGVPGGYSGGAVWGGTPAIDLAHHQVLVTTGNNYTVPRAVDDCQSAGGSPSQCLARDDHLNSIVALDMRSGAIRWTAGPERFDAWNLSCIPGIPAPHNCPDNPGPDFDFADGPHLLTVRGHGRPRQIVGAGQKSGEYWAVDAASGEILWSTAAGPGGFNGGIQFGSATDGRRIYLAEADSGALPYTLPNGQTISAGSFAALDPASGRILWQTADPTGNADTAAVTTANGVVYTSSLSGRMFALDATTGAILWDFQGAGASAAGPAVVGGTVYWGNGYNRLGPPDPNAPHVFYAFSLKRR